MGTSATGNELWKSDGTLAGTVPVKNINPGAASSSPQELINFNGTILFSMKTAAGRELWKSNGTAAGTVLVKLLNPGVGILLLGPMVILNGAAFFGATEPTTGIELWKSDGAAAGTVLVKDINPGAAGLWRPHWTVEMLYLRKPTESETQIALNWPKILSRKCNQQLVKVTLGYGNGEFPQRRPQCPVSSC